MDPNRVTEIHNPHTCSGGTGYLIREDLVLTAYHVIIPQQGGKAADSACDVRFVGDLNIGRVDWQTAEASLCWADRSIDLALLKLKHGKPTFLSRDATGVQFGKLGNETITAQGLGFPLVQKIGKRQNLEPVEGKLSRLAGLRENQLRLQVTSLIPSYPEQWSGISGTALFVKQYLVGIVIETNKSFGEKALWTAPISLVARNREFCQLVMGNSALWALPLVDVENLPPGFAAKQAEISKEEVALKLAYHIADGKFWQEFSEEEFRVKLSQETEISSANVSQVVALLKHKNLLQVTSTGRGRIKFTAKGKMHYQQNYLERS